MSNLSAFRASLSTHILPFYKFAIDVERHVCRRQAAPEDPPVPPTNCFQIPIQDGLIEHVGLSLPTVGLAFVIHEISDLPGR